MSSPQWFEREGCYQTEAGGICSALDDSDHVIWIIVTHSHLGEPNPEVAWLQRRMPLNAVGNCMSQPGRVAPTERLNDRQVLSFSL